MAVCPYPHVILFQCETLLKPEHLQAGQSHTPP